MKHLNNFKIKQITFLTLSLIALVGCSDSNMDKYGKGKAYNYTSDGNMIYGPSVISYYVDTSVTGNYKTAVTNAINKADNLSNNVTVKTTNSSSSVFKIQVKQLGKSADPGQNSYSCSKNPAGKITKSTITLNSSYTDNLDFVQHVVLHEIGHTFGLTDLEYSEAVKYSIMYKSVKKDYWYDDYQEFDKKNIARHYK